MQAVMDPIVFELEGAKVELVDMRRDEMRQSGLSMFVQAQLLQEWDGGDPNGLAVGFFVDSNFAGSGYFYEIEPGAVAGEICGKVLLALPNNPEVAEAVRAALDGYTITTAEGELTLRLKA